MKVTVVEMRHSEFQKYKQAFIRTIPTIQRGIHELSNNSDETCYTSSVVAKRILDTSGVKSQIIYVQGVVENEIAKTIREQYGLDDLSRFKNACIINDGWTMGVGIGNDTNGRPNFHAVLYFPEIKEVLDMTIKQMHRPQYGIHMPDYYWGGVEGYKALFSEGFPRNMLQIENFNKIFKPMIDRDIRFKGLIQELIKDYKAQIEE